jgi:hypothetical protein
MGRRISALTIAFAASISSMAITSHVTRASGGNDDIQTVSLQRQGCPANTGTAVGTARFSLDDQGGGNVNPNGVEIDLSVNAGMPRTAYTALILGSSCQVLVDGGTLTTDDRGRGDLGFHVPGTSLPPGTSVRAQLVAPSSAAPSNSGSFTDVLTSDSVAAP